MLKSVILALGFCFGAYLSLTYLCINIYGEQNIKPSIFDNLKEEFSTVATKLTDLEQEVADKSTGLPEDMISGTNEN